jgi:hypothetical protein
MVRPRTMVAPIMKTPASKSSATYRPSAPIPRIATTYGRTRSHCVPRARVYDVCVVQWGARGKRGSERGRGDPRFGAW